EHDTLALIALTSAPLPWTILGSTQPQRGCCADRSHSTARIEHEQVDLTPPLPSDHDVELTLRLVTALVDEPIVVVVVSVFADLGHVDGRGHSRELRRARRRERRALWRARLAGSRARNDERPEESDPRGAGRRFSSSHVPSNSSEKGGPGRPPFRSFRERLGGLGR